MGELEEQQNAELFQVVAVGEAVVAEDGAVAPELLDYAVGFCRHLLQEWNGDMLFIVWRY
jgi:hypothetical protein